MKDRIQTIIKYAGESQKDFAQRMGWSPQYLNKLVRGDSIGLQPIVSILEQFPQIDARWLLLGEGTMIAQGHDVVRDRIYSLLRIEKYMPIMSADEIRRIEAGDYSYTEEDVQRWEQQLAERNEVIRERFQAAQERMSRCKQ